jgi:hypothetical protein
MSIFDPKQMGAGAERDPNGERDDNAALPTRFGRDRRRRQQRPHWNSAARHTACEPRTAPDDEHPFDDDGGL